VTWKFRFHVYSGSEWFIVLSSLRSSGRMSRTVEESELALVLGVFSLLESSQRKIYALFLTYKKDYCPPGRLVIALLVDL
jgi:hypothetical protein